MKKTSIVLVTIAMTVPISSVLAQTPNIEAVRPTSIQKVETRFENRIEKMEERNEVKKEIIENKFENKKERIEERASTTEKRTENKKEAKKEINRERIMNLLMLTTRKINAAINRIEILANRTEERLNILVDKGVVKEETKIIVLSKLTEAKSVITDAKDSVVKVEEATKLAIEKDDAKSAIKEVKLIAKQIEEKVRIAHSKVVEAINAIKGSLPKTEQATTTTPIATTTATTTQN